MFCDSACQLVYFRVCHVSIRARCEYLFMQIIENNDEGYPFFNDICASVVLQGNPINSNEFKSFIMNGCIYMWYIWTAPWNVAVSK